MLVLNLHHLYLFVFFHLLNEQILFAIICLTNRCFRRLICWYSFYVLSLSQATHLCVSRPKRNIFHRARVSRKRRSHQLMDEKRISRRKILGRTKNGLRTWENQLKTQTQTHLSSSGEMASHGGKNDLLSFRPEETPSFSLITFRYIFIFRVTKSKRIR